MNTLPVAIHDSCTPAVQADSPALRTFFQQANQAPMLTEQQEFELATRYRERNDLDAAHRLVQSYLRLVIKIARDYANYQLNMVDLIQEGSIGLMHAVKKFDPQRGNRLSAYAVWWIRASIHEYILNAWRMVKIATTQVKRQLFFKLRQSKESLAPLGHDEAVELAEKFDTDPQTILEMDSRMSAGDSSLNQPLSEDGAEVIELLADERPNQEQQLGEEQSNGLMNRLIQEGLGQLNPREQAIIAARFLGDHPQTLEELSQQFSVSRERIRQIEKRAMEKLKGYFQNHPGRRELALSLA